MLVDIAITGLLHAIPMQVVQYHQAQQCKLHWADFFYEHLAPAQRDDAWELESIRRQVNYACRTK